ncbi:MAG: putative toxin-antitoxin system toxin component, PIN family [Candidatus Portnoybacteria bacterium]|nr:putative toxin-antitoxin system toxin component, PIN family [Candidatus Portnoybacteria bacterium]
MKIKVVLDTNIYISAILFGGGPRMCLELARKGKIDLYASKAIFLELARILKTKFDWQENEIRAILQGISQFSHIVTPKMKISLIQENPPDNRILEAVKEAKADCIVSGDKKHILPLKKFRGSEILTSADFLKKVTSLPQ